MPLEEHQWKAVASVLVMLFAAVAFQGQILVTMAESLNRFNRQREELVSWFVLNRQDVTRISQSTPCASFSVLYSSAQASSSSISSSLHTNVFLSAFPFTFAFSRGISGAGMKTVLP